MKNTKPIMRKTLSLFLVVLLLLLMFSPAKINFYNDIIVQGESDSYQMQSFTNTNFDTTMPDAEYESQEEYVPFSKIFADYIEEKIINGSDVLDSNDLNEEIGEKKVSISSPEDLYNLSISVSYNFNNTAEEFDKLNIQPNFDVIDYLLSLDYILLCDIDYSYMKSKQFIPLGFKVTVDEVVQEHYFTGTFDGNGFTIKNLYLAEYDYITYIISGTEEQIPFSEYYAMFANVSSEAKICNLTLQNPILDLRDVPDLLTNASNLVGFNQGTVYNCSVVDERSVQGITWTLPQGASASEEFTASGLVHTNAGSIYNSYYVSDNVVTEASAFRFDTQPVIYSNSGLVSNVYYNEDVISENYDSISGVTDCSKEEIKSGEGITLNGVMPSSINTIFSWHFFKDDCYPTMEGLTYNSTHDGFEIKNGRDFLIFIKLLSRVTTFDDKKYSEQKYIIMNDIDMSNYKDYVIPQENFGGILTGVVQDELSADKTNENKTIGNLKIKNPYTNENEIYYGLFSQCSGEVSYLNFNNCEIEIQANNAYISKTTYIGIVCGKLNRGKICNVISNAQIKNSVDKGAIGKAYVGGIAGYGNGEIYNVANKGDIDLGSELKFSKLNIETPKYQIGGILGGSTESDLSLYNAINEGDITGLGTKDSFTVTNADDKKIEISIGGIVGQLNNSTSTNNSVYLVTNDGTISSNRFDGTEPQPCYVYVSGIIGNVIGKSGELGTGSQVLNGQYENNGLIKYNDDAVSEYTTIYNAGILVASTTTYSHFSYMTNNGVGDSGRKNYNLYDELKMTSANNNINIYYAATVIDNSSEGITLSRAYNEFNFVYDNDYFTSDNALIGPFFTSVSNKRSKLLYCTNNGNLSVVGESVIATTGETRIAGITQSYNVDYENIYVSGNITVGNFKQGEHLYVAGIGWILPYCNEDSPNYAKNCLNEGKIVTYNIQGETTITNPSGEGSEATNFAATTTAHNLYVGGLFNLNVGNITNSMNRADITSLEGSNPEIAGTCNTFVGGLVTFNYNLIQDCANSGDIKYTNSNATSKTYAAGGDTPDNFFGGMIFAYNGGLALGGVCSALADTEALILDEESNGTADYGHLKTIDAQILDSSNNGNVFGKANQYVRSGGVLAVALGVEITAGNDSTAYNSEAKTFSWHEVGSGDRIADALLSNGLNFGNICAITNKIGRVDYVTGRNGNQHARPGIYSCAGGVIGYGLCKMNRMINHGVISSCDTAGGVVGATYILGTRNVSNWNPTYNTTIVDINTAVHYGKVKAAKVGSYSSFNYTTIENYDNPTYYYSDGDTTFIFKNTQTSSSLGLNQDQKRGFGGIFGRLQRGNSGRMTSRQFNNVLNMDPNVDMIGRADGSGYDAYIFYCFYNPDQGDTYYSARVNDTTPNVVIGHITRTSTRITIQGADSITFTFSRRENYYGEVYYVYAFTASNPYGLESSIEERSVYDYTGTARTVEKVLDSTEFSDDTYTSSNNLQLNISDNDYFKFTDEQIEIIKGLTYNGNDRATYTFDDFEFEYSRDTNTSNSIRQYQVEIVTDDPANTDYTYIFADDFPLMSEMQTDYIYHSQEDALADRFRGPTIEDEKGDEQTNPSYNELTHKPNGMYVLASTQGRDKGAVLPANLKIDNLLKLNEENGYIDLGNLSSDHLIYAGKNYEELYNDYKAMFQISYSDKSAIMTYEEDDSEVYDIVLNATGTDVNSPRLTNGVVGTETITLDGKEVIIPTITFTVSKDAFATLDSASTTVHYTVESADLSENAVVAKYGLDASAFTSFKDQYDQRKSNIMSPNFEPSINGTINTTNSGSQLLGYVTVYSQIASQISGLFNKYRTDYKIYIIVDQKDITLNLNSTLIDEDDATPSNYTPGGFEWTYPETQPVSQNGTLSLTMEDVNKVLPLNHELICTGLYYNGTTEVDEDYYEITTTGKTVIDTDTHVMTITITLSDKLINGTYIFRFKYYSNVDTEYLVTFTKAASTDYSILDVNYDSFSLRDDVNDTVFDPVIAREEEEFPNIKTYIGFDVLLGGVEVNNNTVYSYDEIENDKDSYLHEIDGYDLMIDGKQVATIKLAPFATLDSWSIKYEFDIEGYLKQNLTYIVKSADQVGKEATSSIVHTIMERTLPKAIIYKDGVIQSYVNDEENAVPLITADRESELTEIKIDLGFTNESRYSEINVTNTDNVNVIHDKNNKSPFVILNVTQELAPGTAQTYDISIERKYSESAESDTITGEIILQKIQIEKLKGTSAYLKDIRFQLSENASTVYPTFAEADANGVEVENSKYDIRGYYAGIDYDGADDDGITNFIIDGKVANEDLENYCPKFTWPIGATITRVTRENGELKDAPSLYANYLGVLNEDGEYEVEPIIYKIVSEDKSHTVYYYITALDLLYNLTMKFKIYFELSNGDIVDTSHAESLINDNIVVINVVNYELQNGFDYTIDDSGNFPYEVGEEGIKSQIKYKFNQATLFQTLNINTDKYEFSFGRNRSGCYKLHIITPIYNGESTPDGQLVKGSRFNYDIYLGSFEQTGGTYDSSSGRLLSDFDSEKEYVGKYFYIENPAIPRPRVKEFSIVIRHSTENDSWGLTDDSNTWN